MDRFLARRSAGQAGSDPAWGPYAVDELRDLLARGALVPTDELRRESSSVWAPAAAWVILNVQVPPPARHLPEHPDAPPKLVHALLVEAERLRWWLREGERVLGPVTGAEIRSRLDDGSPATDLSVSTPSPVFGAALGATGAVALVGGDGWVPISELRAACSAALRGAAEADSEPHAVPAEVDIGTMCCAICLERVPAGSPLCPECGEPPVLAPHSHELDRAAASLRPRSLAPSIADDPPNAGWLRLHWRPLVTMGVIGCVLAAGIALRHLAPDRYQPPKHISPPPAAAACDTPCWHGEACQVGSCVWQAPNDVDHVSAEPVIGGPFTLPPDVIDILPLDEERFAASALKGVIVYSGRTGEILSLVSDAPQAQGLYRVGSTLYATSAQRIYVIDVASTRVLKTIEIGSRVHEVTVGASGRRALASVPGLRLVVVITTDFHAEINRFYFGDDTVGPVAIDDVGTWALTTTGRNPLPGLRPPQGGALYAFDPSRLASAQDKVRAAMVGNPADLVMTPDETAYVVVREKNSLVPLSRLTSGAVRREQALETCGQPEQIELIRRGRRAIVRCNEGRTIEIFDLVRKKLVRHIPLNARATDLVVSPDARQAIIALPYDGAGAVGLLDLDSYELTLAEVGAEPSRVRVTPDGRTAAVISDRTKVAWVVR